MLMTRVIDWPEDSRLSGMGGAPQGRGTGLDGVVSFLHIDLPDGQQGNAESTMAHAHLPHAGTSIHGTYPDGSEWMVLTQVAIVDPVQGFATFADAAEAFTTESRRYRQLNPDAWLVSRVLHSREQLLRGYSDRGITSAVLIDWSIDELLAGWICEMCNVDLPAVVAGREAGCAFPDLEHYCTGDGFTDVFAQWSRGLLVG